MIPSTILENKDFFNLFFFFLNEILDIIIHENIITTMIVAIISFPIAQCVLPTFQAKI